jgi:hypothetical protein
MKITKRQIRRLIQEQMQGGNTVWVLYEPSHTYGGEDVELKLLGIFDSPDKAAEASGDDLNVSLMQVELNRYDRFGYHEG